MKNKRTPQYKWVMSLLKKTHGYFLEIGAYDGVLRSNTWWLEKKHNWTGICIEPLRDKFDELRQNRGCICDNNVIMSNHKPVKFVSCHSRSGIFTDFSGRRVTKLGSRGKYEIRTPVTLTEVLTKYNAPSTIDYFSLDVEGAEYEVIKSCDLTKYKFLTMTVEQSIKRENHNKLLQHLYAHGYVMHTRNLIERQGGSDDGLIHQDLLKQLKIKGL